MKYSVPDRRFHSVTELTPALLHQEHVRALLLDVDNTLTLPGDQTIQPEIRNWLEQLKTYNVGLAVVSNNKRSRVEPFARRLGIAFISRAAKPFPWGFRRARKLLNLPKESIAVVGDQIFTDVLGARIGGLRAWLVEPYVMEPGWFFRLKRRMERRPLAVYERLHSDEQKGKREEDQ